MYKKIWLIICIIFCPLLADCSIGNQLSLDPCHWNRDKPVRTAISDGYRIELAPKTDEKKIVFIFKKDLSTENVGWARSMRVEVIMENYLSHLQDELATTSHSIYKDTLQANIISIETYFNSHDVLDGNLAFEHNSEYGKFDWGWFLDSIEQGNLAIYDFETGKCVPYIEVKEWGYSCGELCGEWGREFYMPNGILFLRTIDMVS